MARSATNDSASRTTEIAAAALGRSLSIAVVQGHAVGAGFQLALACDLRVLSEDAQLCMRETSLGLVPDLGGTQPLVETVVPRVPLRLPRPVTRGLDRSAWRAAPQGVLSGRQVFCHALAGCHRSADRSRSANAP